MPLSGLNQTRRPRWMLVDDDILNVALLGRLLRQHCEAEIECFDNSREALTAFLSAPDRFDLIVTDLEMPGMDGLELCRQMRAISPPVKIVLATGSGLMTRESASQAGFCGLLRKPFPVEALLTVAEAAGRAATGREPGRDQAECRATR